MRFLIAGCGSMGKRRARCLRKLGFDDIVAVDPREDRRSEIAAQSQAKTTPSIDDGLAARPDFALVCTPPHRHTPVLLACIEAGLPVFCEAPLTVNLEDADQVIAAAASRGAFIAPSCTYLCNAIHRKARRIIEESRFGRLLAYLSHAGQHVADWHPYEDYRGFYASKRSEGGMCFDMLPHEFAMLSFFAGEVTALSCMARRRSTDIETDPAACDVYDVSLDMETGVSALIHHDIFQRPPGVLRRLLFERGIVEFNWRRLRTAEHKGPKFTGEPDWQDYLLEGYDFEEMYVEELRLALEALEGKAEYIFPIERERRALELVLACEESSETGRHMKW